MSKSSFTLPPRSSRIVGEKEIKLLLLRYGYGKTRSLLIQTLDPVTISLCWQTVSKSFFTLLETLDPVAISLYWGTVSKSCFTLLKMSCQEVQG